MPDNRCLATHASVVARSEKTPDGNYPATPVKTQTSRSGISVAISSEFRTKRAIAEQTKFGWYPILCACEFALVPLDPGAAANDPPHRTHRIRLLAYSTTRDALRHACLYSAGPGATAV